MCLIAKSKFVANENITVYKVLGKGSTEEDWHGVFYPFTFHENQEYSSDISGRQTIIGHLLPQDSFPCNINGMIIEEAFHSFHKLKDAERLLHDIKSNEIDFSIGKFTIPKGAIVYDGFFNIGLLPLDSYASDKIIFNGIMEESKPEQNESSLK